MLNWIKQMTQNHFDVIELYHSFRDKSKLATTKHL